MDINSCIAYFIIYSFLGWVLESVFKTITSKRAVNSGFLYGPLCPIYGFGALIMLIFLKSFKDNIILLFIFGFLVLSIWEYIVGFLLEKTFKTKYWDYSNNKFNIKGRVCLLNSCFWGILGVVFTKLIHPPVQSLIEIVPKELLLYIDIILFMIMIIDYIFSIIKVYNINVNINLLNEISKTIKLELEKIKEYAGNKAKENEKLQRVIEELKQRQDSLKNKIERQTIRLRKAFPTMKSEKISEFLNQRKESIRKNK